MQLLRIVAFRKKRLPMQRDVCMGSLCFYSVLMDTMGSLCFCGVLWIWKEEVIDEIEIDKMKTLERKAVHNGRA